MEEQEGQPQKGPFPEQGAPAEQPQAAAADSTRPSGEVGKSSPAEPEQQPPASPSQDGKAESQVEIPGSEGLSPSPEDSGEELEPAEPAATQSEATEPAATHTTAPTGAQERRAAAAEGLRRGRLPQADGATEGGNEPAWYVIHCYSGYENKVRHNLEQRIETMGMKDRIFDVVIPTQEEIEVKEGKRRTVERHIFPGYVLVNMTLSEESWYVVRNTPGVTGFVGMGNLPTPLRPEEVSQIIKRMESEAPAVKVSFKVGERVRIIDGPFNDFRGTVSDLDMERTKVRVMVSFFGRETPVELDFLQVEKA